MILATALVVLLQAAPVAAQQSDVKAAVSGVVLNSVTGDPIPNVKVSLARTDSLTLGPLANMITSDRPTAEMTIPGELLEAIKNVPDTTPEAAVLKSLRFDDVDSIVISPFGGSAVISKSLLPIFTDSLGRFAFGSVEPGTYRLFFSASGYTNQDYGQKTPGGGGTPIRFESGQSKKDIVMRMIPVSAISGRILDNMGRAIAGVPVQLLHFSYDETAHKKTQRVASALTDDRGDYRFFYLSPGRYFVSAGHTAASPRFPEGQGAMGPFDPGYLSPNRIVQNYAVTYYPGAADVESAKVIDLRSGADLSGIDLFLRPQEAYRLSGRVLDGRTGRPPQRATIDVRPQGADSAALITFIAAGPVTNYKPDGTFEVRNLPPGNYTINANLINPAQRPFVDLNNMSPAERTAYMQNMQAEESTRPKGSANVVVTNANVDAIAIMIGVPGSISGHITIESSRVAPTGTFEFLHVQLKAALESGMATGSGPPDSGTIKPDGTFVIKGIPAGEYHLAMNGVPQGSYIKDARLGKTDVLNNAMSIAGTDTDTLDIVISANAGSIEGVALNGRGQPAPGSQVVLIPVENRNRTELFRPVTADASGHFSIESVTPGNYRLAAWDDIEPYAFFDPELIKQADQDGKQIRVTESSKQNVTISAW
jgi:5-hydroxyisourate hydrolase-like protein (transthyretin family)